ncbi:hypothetical protein [Streptomyces sp. SID12488]|uniref:hypothetical protein n=1 Tax=Streptomyces sp. SID12488 TaxID=2706040 RepID=UPI0013D9235F|nr:hypothetical protein [Streptomyces sp. SID12488]NEA68545.1 hypothetical protein [Streptomyces sp. SID12488]
MAARDPETESAAVERPTQDPEHAVKAAATHHPNLPQSRLEELLDDEEPAHAAAANPALNLETIRRLVRTDGRRVGPPA